MGTVNRVQLLGRLGADPELKATPGGRSVCNMRMVTTERWRQKDGQYGERSDWHRVVIWGELAEECAQRLKKGSQCYVEGSIQTRSWDGKDGRKNYTTEVIVNKVEFMFEKPPAKTKAPREAAAPPPIGPPNADDLPF